MRTLIVSFVAITFAFGLATGATAAEHGDHHPDQSSKATSSDQSTPQGGGESADGGMLGRHGRGMGKMHDRHGGHHGRGPSVVINIYPGGSMGMMSGGMMPGRGMSMMDHGGGMMGQGGMMPGRGMGMMDHGGMMMGQGEAAAADLQITVDQVRERVTAMMARMGGTTSLGEVKELDQDLIDAELTDSSGSPAGRIVVNRHNGAMMRIR